MNGLTSIPRCLQEFGFVAYEKIGEALTALVEAARRALVSIAEVFANLPIWQDRQVQQHTENPLPQDVIPAAQQPKAIDTVKLNVNGTPEELRESLSELELARRLQIAFQTSLEEIARAYEADGKNLEESFEKITIIYNHPLCQAVFLSKFYEIASRIEIDWMSKYLDDYLGSLEKIQRGEVETAQEKLEIKEKIDECLEDCARRFIHPDSNEWLIEDQQFIGKYEQVIESYKQVFSNSALLELEANLDEVLGYLQTCDIGATEEIRFAVAAMNMYVNAEIEGKGDLKGKCDELIRVLKETHNFSADETETTQTKTISF